MLSVLSSEYSSSSEIMRAISKISHSPADIARRRSSQKSANPKAARNSNSSAVQEQCLKMKYAKALSQISEFTSNAALVALIKSSL